MSLANKYIREGHPTIDELVVEQKLAFPRDPHDLLVTSGQKKSPSTTFWWRRSTGEGTLRLILLHEADRRRYRRRFASLQK